MQGNFPALRGLGARFRPRIRFLIPSTIPCLFTTLFSPFPRRLRMNASLPPYQRQALGQVGLDFRRVTFSLTGS